MDKGVRGLFLAILGGRLLWTGPLEEISPCESDPALWKAFWETRFPNEVKPILYFENKLLMLLGGCLTRSEDLKYGHFAVSGRSAVKFVYLLHCALRMINN